MACPESGQRPSTHNWQGRADSVSDVSAPGSSLGLRHTPERPGSQTGGRALPPRGPRCGCRRYRQASRLQAIFRFRTPGITKKCAFQRHKRLPSRHLWFISRDARMVPKRLWEEQERHTRCCPVCIRRAAWYPVLGALTWRQSVTPRAPPGHTSCPLVGSLQREEASALCLPNLPFLSLLPV